ncbi:MAG: hypothetical protein LBN07_04190 [Christensenellaceae bacterium]|nr:hypothetical protein [Christensenellaceae bacterium]
MFKRTIILNSLTKGDTRKAVLNLNGGEVLSGEVKLFNFGDIGKLAVGIYDRDDVIKIPLEFKGGVCSFKTNKYVNLDEKLTCALVDLTHSRYPEVILGGITTQSDYGFVEAAFLENVNNEELYETESKEELEKLIDREIYDDQSCDSCAECKYKKAFYEEPQSAQTAEESEKDFQGKDAEDEENLESFNAKTAWCFETFDTAVCSNEPLKGIIKKDEAREEKEAAGFLDQIKGQIDDMFEKHSKDEELEALIEGSKWIRVNYEQDDSFYVLGLIFQNEEVKYIAYGLSSDSKSTPPADLREYAQWLPVTDDPIGRGYWVVYQDALSGENISMEEVV